jgi:NADPH-dependent glutamate synthase beta subunit-like oxidoreductase
MVEGRAYRPVIRPERCHSCDVCIRGCPAEIVTEYGKEKRSLRGTLYTGKLEGRSRKEKVSLPPCQEACPIHQDARGYVALIAKGRFKEALELIRKVNPLPAVCGFICHHPCEEACLREGVDQPIPIRLLKRFVAEYDRQNEKKTRRLSKRRPGRVLIIGSGPAGLAAANDLSLLGYGATIFEALPVFGGMLAVGIPAYRLPRDILRVEIDGIRQLGVEMEANHPFYFDGDSRKYRKLGFDAVFLSIGAHRSQRLNVPGETFPGVLPGVEFLRDLNLGKRIKIGRRVVVIGGGNVAIDAARSAFRLGAESVEIYYRRSREEMPAYPEEVEEAIREGVRIHFLSSPVKIIGKGGKAIGMESVRMELRGLDGTGRKKPVPVERSNFKVRANAIIAAVGQRVDRKSIEGLETHADGTVRVDPGTGQTSMKGVFAGGDVATGPGMAIDAIAAGKKGAVSMHEYLS